MFVYFAHPIDAVKDDDTLANITRKLLDSSKIPIYDPGTAWASCHSKVTKIYDVNNDALSVAACVLAVLDGFSVGVPAELERAKYLGIPAVVVCRPEYQKHTVLHVLATAGLYTDPMAAIGKIIELFESANQSRDVKLGLVELEPPARGFPLPAQSKPGDIGLDLYVSKDFVIPAHEFRGVPASIKVQPPDDIWFMILGRSSSLHRRGLLVVPSVIDTGFRGTLFAMAYNIMNTPCDVKRGERIAQLIPMQNIPFVFSEVEAVSESVRGHSGFGSTGL
jgi:dUTP pyrophosphatase